MNYKLRGTGQMIRAVFVTMLMILISSGFAHAKVKGVCSNCHTMHNSQNGSAIYTETPKVGGPGTYLLTTKCIACHSSTDSSPTKTLGGNTVPIVYNTVEPSKITAGGNFWYVQNKGDKYGHNVITVDTTLSSAPGASETGVGCGFGGCHVSLAQIRLGPGPCAGTNCVIGNGCIGCHVPKHHAPDPGPVVKEENGCYRFLGRPSWVWDIPPHSSRSCVEGIEDPDWELTVSPTDHNEYRDTDKPAAPYSPGYTNPQGISDFCAGCHRDYHSWDRYSGGARNRSGGNWLRHPAGDTKLPSTGEYAAYTTYNPQAPVSRPNLTTVSSTVTPGVDRVMCLSCHRAHGSPYPDMLRWNYDDMIAGDNSKSGGCFTCHTQKNQTP